MHDRPQAQREEQDLRHGDADSEGGPAEIEGRQGADGLAHIDLAQRVPEARRAHDELAGEKQRPGERVAPIARRGVNLGRQGGRF